MYTKLELAQNKLNGCIRWKMNQIFTYREHWTGRNAKMYNIATLLQRKKPQGTMKHFAEPTDEIYELVVGPA